MILEASSQAEKKSARFIELVLTRASEVICAQCKSSCGQYTQILKSAVPNQLKPAAAGRGARPEATISMFGRP